MALIASLVGIITACGSQKKYSINEDNYQITLSGDCVGNISRTDNGDMISSVEMCMEILWGCNIIINKTEYKFSENGYDVYYVEAISQPSAAMSEQGEKDQLLKLYISMNKGKMAYSYMLDDYNYTEDFEQSIKDFLSKK